VSNEFLESQVNNRSFRRVFGNNYGDISFGSILNRLAEFSSMINPGVVGKLEVDTRDPDHVRFFFASESALEPALYSKALELLSQLSSYEPLEVGSLVSTMSSAHVPDASKECI